MKPIKQKYLVYFIVLLFFLYLLFVGILSILGKLSVPSNFKFIGSSGVVWVNFFELENEYTQVSISASLGSKPNQKDSSIDTRECAKVRVKRFLRRNPIIIIKEDKVCSSFGPCTEGMLPDNSCHFKESEYLVTDNAEFLKIK